MLPELQRRENVLCTRQRRQGEKRKEGEVSTGYREKPGTETWVCVKCHRVGLTGRCLRNNDTGLERVQWLKHLFTVHVADSRNHMLSLE